MTLSGKAWQQAIFEQHNADQRYGLDHAGPAEDIYFEGRKYDHEPAPGIGRVHRHDEIEDEAA